MTAKQQCPRADSRPELVRILVGGSVLVLLALAYLLLASTGRDQHGLLGVIGMGLGYALGGRGGRAG
jgi:hypothetical protein